MKITDTDRINWLEDLLLIVRSTRSKADVALVFANRLRQSAVSFDGHHLTMREAIDQAIERERQ